MLYDVVLERWFKNGSQRYLVDNLGYVEIVPLSFSESINRFLSYQYLVALY